MQFKNVYVRNTKLKTILLDGWSRGFEPAQTLREAMMAGYAMCVVVPLITRMRKLWDDQYWQASCAAACSNEPLVELVDLR